MALDPVSKLPADPSSLTSFVASWVVTTTCWQFISHFVDIEHDVIHTDTLVAAQTLLRASCIR